MSQLKTADNGMLLNYIINQDPTLTEGITDLPKQGENISKIGEIIVNNKRYKNAFINAINVIAVTLISDHDWRNPWEEFTEQGEISVGQSVREMVLNLVEGHDYNEALADVTGFLKTEVPDVMQYMHEINFQKFYKTTVNDSEISLAFNTKEGVYNLIEKVYKNLRKSYVYDKYLIDKYQIQRRIVDGTVPSVTIKKFDTNTPRQNVTAMKEVSNNMIFMSGNYNPAAYVSATDFEHQRAIISTGFEAQISTEVLATSFFKNEAELKTKLALIDGFGKNDFDRLKKLLGNEYKEFTSAEKLKLEKVVGMIISDDFFKDYKYAIDEQAEFSNPEQLTKTMWLHIWRIFSTSPYENCVCFTKEDSSVTSVTVSPLTATVEKGQELKFSAVVVTGGITNKAVIWSIDEPAIADGVTINQSGRLSVPAEATVSEITVTATSVYNGSKKGTATVTVNQPA